MSVSTQLKTKSRNTSRFNSTLMDEIDTPDVEVSPNVRIDKTKDYSIFNALRGNRPLSSSHIKKLMESVTERNKLYLHPIIVNKNMEVIDGQHRLEVAKRLELDVYYMQVDIEDEHVIDANFNQKCFSTSNFINFFSIRETNPDYVKLNALMKISGLSPKSLLNLIFGNVNNTVLQFLKTGRLKLPEDASYDAYIDQFIVIMDFCKERKIKPLGMLKHYNATKALRWLFNTDGFEMTVLIGKMQQRWFDICPQSSALKWYKLFLEIYNYKSKNRLESLEGLLDD